MKLRVLYFLALVAALCASCGKSSTDLRDVTAIVAISADVDSFSPVFANNEFAVQMLNNISPQMFDVSFNLMTGMMEYKPGLVRQWEITNEGREIKLFLRSDVRWQDGQRVTARDIKFAYQLYGDPALASPRSNFVENMLKTNGEFDVNKSITIIDDSTLVFHFAQPSYLILHYCNLYPIPEHQYRKYQLDDLRQQFIPPLSAGPFKLGSRKPQAEIVLEKNLQSNLPSPSKLAIVVFRIIPELTTRIAELKQENVDLVAKLLPENVKDIQQSAPNIRLEKLPPMRYDYVGWANIDFAAYRDSKGKVVRPHRLFGDKRVRQAMTYAINRRGMVESFLGPAGEVAITDFSPIFRWAVNSDLIAYPYNPERARQLLSMAGWTDSDNDGILDKNGIRFEFTLNYNTGNPLRERVATMIQQNLKEVGVSVRLASSEPNVLYQNIRERRYDAFIAGLAVDLEIDPAARWGDISSPSNYFGFSHPQLVSLINTGIRQPTPKQAAPFWQNLQSIIHEEQPCTFLYWNKEVVGIHRRLQNTSLSALGVLDRMWEWTIGGPLSANTY